MSPPVVLERAIARRAIARLSRGRGPSGEHRAEARISEQNAPLRGGPMRLLSVGIRARLAAL